MKKRAFEVTEEDDLQFVVSEDDVQSDNIVVEEETEGAAAPIQVGAWADANSFVRYCVASVKNAPQVRADNNSSIMRAVAYFDNLQSEIAEGIASDAEHSDLTMNQLETLDAVMDRVYVAEEQLKEAIKRTNILKTAAKSARFVYMVDPFLFAIARLIVNAKVANGKNIEDTFAKVSKKYAIDERETLALRQIIRDMGYPIHGSFVADDGAYDMITQYFA